MARRLPHVRQAVAIACVAAAAALPLASPAAAQTTRRGKNAPAPTPPIEVVLRDPLREGSAASRAVAKRLRLEAGVVVRPTQFIAPADTRSNRERYILLAVQRVEGGYDAVNLYDRGIVSWGLMQWAAHAGSLQHALWYAKQRLAEKGKADLWAALFKAQGLDVQRVGGAGGEPVFCVGGTNRITGVTSWRPVATLDELRVVFRGTKKPGVYDPATITRWAKVFARAGRNPVLQSIQDEWATRRLRDCLDERLAGARVGEVTGGDLFSDALYFSFWTNNPRAAREHFTRAMSQARAVTGETKPEAWPPALFPFLLEVTGRRSAFGTWPDRTEQVAQVIGAGGVGRQLAATQLASRGWNVTALGRGSLGRAGRGPAR